MPLHRGVSELPAASTRYVGGRGREDPIKARLSLLVLLIAIPGLALLAGQGKPWLAWAEAEAPTAPVAPVFTSTPTVSPTPQLPGVRRVEALAQLSRFVQLAVIADVRDVTVHWNADRTRIETTARLSVVEVSAGASPAEISVTQPGGELDGLGLAV